MGAGLATGLIPYPKVVDGQKIVRPWEWPMPETSDCRRCDPEVYLHPWVPMMSRFADAWENGLLPNAGGVMDQPAKLIAGIQHYRNALIHCRNTMQAAHDAAQEAYGG